MTLSNHRSILCFVGLTPDRPRITNVSLLRICFGNRRPVQLLPLVPNLTVPLAPKIVRIQEHELRSIGGRGDLQIGTYRELIQRALKKQPQDRGTTGAGYRGTAIERPDVPR